MNLTHRLLPNVEQVEGGDEGIIEFFSLFSYAR